MSLVNQTIKIKEIGKKTHFILKNRAKYSKKWCKTDKNLLSSIFKEH